MIHNQPELHLNNNNNNGRPSHEMWESSKDGFVHMLNVLWASINRQDTPMWSAIAKADSVLVYKHSTFLFNSYINKLESV